MKSNQFFAVVLFLAFVMVPAGYGQQTPEQLYQSALYKEEIEGELDAAIKIYETVIKQYPENRPVVAKSLLHSGICKERLGMKEAQKAFERVVREYNDQSEVVAQAKERLAILGSPGDKKGFVTRRILTDASSVSGALTTDGVKQHYFTDHCR
jgi:TolA-binding protein